MTSLPGIGIIGCGLIGKKRAFACLDAPVIALADVAGERARALAGEVAAKGGNALDMTVGELLARPDIALVVISTTNESLASLALSAIGAGKHVLLEKPAARSVAELDEVIAAARDKGVLVRVGFNHRFHPAVLKARELFESGEVGEMMFIRARYGHGGRVGYEKEWRSERARSGGGELIDQGVHIIDLARMFMGEFKTVEGFAANYFWGGEVEDNGFMLLRTAENRAAFLHASCTEWKNMFSMEIYGKKGKIQIEGLGGSYGVESVTLYSMLEEMGPPDTRKWEYPRGDDSWRIELREFAEDARFGRTPSPSAEDARAALVVVEEIYRKSGLPVFGQGA